MVVPFDRPDVIDDGRVDLDNLPDGRCKAGTGGSQQASSWSCREPRSGSVASLDQYKRVVCDSVTQLNCTLGGTESSSDWLRLVVTDGRRKRILTPVPISPDVPQETIQTDRGCVPASIYVPEGADQ